MASTKDGRRYSSSSRLRFYGQFEERVGLIVTGPGGKKAQVIAAVERLPEQFQVADVERVCAGGESGDD